MNRPKLKRLKGYIQNGMLRLIDSGELKEHKNVLNVLIDMERIIDEIVKTFEELDEEKWR